MHIMTTLWKRLPFGEKMFWSFASCHWHMPPSKVGPNKAIVPIRQRACLSSQKKSRAIIIGACTIYTATHAYDIRACAGHKLAKRAEVSAL